VLALGVVGILLVSTIGSVLSGDDESLQAARMQQMATAAASGNRANRSIVTIVRSVRPMNAQPFWTTLS
jgi:hypothetical protein